MDPERSAETARVEPRVASPYFIGDEIGTGYARLARVNEAAIL